MTTWATNCTASAVDSWRDLWWRTFSVETEVGPPQASNIFTSEQLAAVGMVGLYSVTSHGEAA